MKNLVILLSVFFFNVGLFALESQPMSKKLEGLNSRTAYYLGKITDGNTLVSTSIYAHAQRIEDFFKTEQVTSDLRIKSCFPLATEIKVFGSLTVETEEKFKETASDLKIVYIIAGENRRFSIGECPKTMKDQPEIAFSAHTLSDVSPAPSCNAQDPKVKPAVTTLPGEPPFTTYSDKVFVPVSSLFPCQKSPN